MGYYSSRAVCSKADQTWCVSFCEWNIMADSDQDAVLTQTLHWITAAQESLDCWISLYEGIYYIISLTETWRILLDLSFVMHCLVLVDNMSRLRVMTLPQTSKTNMTPFV